MKVVVGSKNPAKVEAVETAFLDRWKDAVILSVETESGVSKQPFSDEETIEGAINRANRALVKEPADIGVGLEGGVVETKQGLCLCNWGALAAKGSQPLIAGGARILLPDEIAQRLKCGEELGPVMDEYTKKKDVRKKEGAIGIFTAGLVTRDEMFAHVMMLLIGQYLFKESVK
jgi:inosine/xanthosine triphosphatase